jgi:hypothetical protein
MTAVRPWHHGKHEADESWELWYIDRQLFLALGDITPGTGKHRAES